MAECKECVHNEVCPVPHLKDTTVCKQFKDRTKYAEVVRCKDCNHFKETNGKDSGKPCGYGKCMKPFFIQMIVDAYDFCSYGERREGK